MAYETGASSGCNDLLDKIAVFATGQGWTVDYLGAGVAAGTRWLHLHSAAGHHVDIYSEAPDIYALGARGYTSGAANWDNQPQRSGKTRTDLTMSGFPGYWLFGDANQIMCVVERSTGVFRHFGMGTLDKVGAFTGGEWVTSTNFSYANISEFYYCSGPFDYFAYYQTHPTTEVRAEIEGNLWYGARNWDLNLNASDNFRNEPRAIWTGRGGMEEDMQIRTPNTNNGLSVLAPIRCAIERGASGLYTPIGSVRNVKNVNLSLLAPKEEITFGPDTWKVFPVSAKLPSVVTPPNYGSGMYGVAYRKVV